MDYNNLIEKAKEAMNHAYSKYSNFNVGAALVTKSGKIYTGCNIENSSYGATICAERVAFSKAVSEGEREFDAIAIVSSSGDYTYPCGICRQFMSEWGTDLKLIFANEKDTKVYTLKELLPEAFTKF
ncbi:MAG: cytidine deaminase [Clostridiales bacterium GWB2_37_7]|nr:MAG: cytidine deaminase [Clostridiales bacterium GWB2_37_7]